MPIGREVGLGPGDPVPLPKTCTAAPHFSAGLLWPNGWMDQNATWHGGRPYPGHIVLDRDPCSSPPQKEHSPQFSVHVCYGQMAGLIKIPLGSEVGRGPGDIVLDGDPSPPK